MDKLKQGYLNFIFLCIVSSVFDFLWERYFGKSRCFDFHWLSQRVSSLQLPSFVIFSLFLELNSLIHNSFDKWWSFSMSDVFKRLYTDIIHLIFSPISIHLTIQVSLFRLARLARFLVACYVTLNLASSVLLISFSQLVG